MEIKEIISKLEYYDGTFPREALEAAIEKQDEIIPELLDALNKVIQDAEGYASKSDYTLHTHALYLLAQFREKQAYPVIHKFFSLPWQTLNMLVHSAHIEQAGKLLASVCGGDLSLIKELIENSYANAYARTSVIDAFKVLMVNGELSREEIIEYFTELFDYKLEQNEAFIWNGLIMTCLDLNAFEFLDRIKIAFSNKFVMEEATTLDQVTEAYEYIKKHPNILHEDDYKNTFIDDAIKEMEYLKDVSKDDEDIASNYSETVRTEPKIGRNQPCPCGSGKKYKKCCGK